MMERNRFWLPGSLKPRGFRVPLLHSGETLRMWWQAKNWRVKYKRWINSAVEAQIIGDAT